MLTVLKEFECFDKKQGQRLVTVKCNTHSISCGKTSAKMLIDSVLGLAVGAAAGRIFNMAI